MTKKGKKYVGWGTAWERAGIKAVIITNAKSKKAAVAKLETFLDTPESLADAKRVCVVLWPGPEGVKQAKPIDWQREMK